MALTQSQAIAAGIIPEPVTLSSIQSPAWVSWNKYLAGGGAVSQPAPWEVAAPSNPVYEPATAAAFGMDVYGRPLPKPVVQQPAALPPVQVTRPTVTPPTRTPELITVRPPSTATPDLQGYVGYETISGYQFGVKPSGDLVRLDVMFADPSPIPEAWRSNPEGYVSYIQGGIQANQLKANAMIEARASAMDSARIFSNDIIRVPGGGNVTAGKYFDPGTMTAQALGRIEVSLDNFPTFSPLSGSIAQAFGAGPSAGFGGGSTGGRGQSLMDMQLGAMGSSLAGFFGVGSNTGTQSSRPNVMSPTETFLYPWYQGFNAIGKAYTEYIGKPLSGLLDAYGSAPVLKLMEGQNNFFSSWMTGQVTTAEAFSRGLLVAGPPATAEFIGMILPGGEVLARETIKNPVMFPTLAGLGLKMQAEGTFEGLTTRPAEFLGENIAIMALTYGAGKALKTAIPLKYTGKLVFDFEETMPKTTYRGFYVESPLKSVQKLFGDAPEWSGIRNIGGITTTPSKGWIPEMKITGGTPFHLEPFITREGFVPMRGRSVVEVPIMRNLLEREGAPGAAKVFEAQLKTIESLYGVKPTVVRNPYQQIEEVSIIKRGTGGEFLDLLKTTAPEHKISGSFSQSVQSLKYPGVHDIDVYVKNPAQVARQLAGDYFTKYYGPDNVQVSGGKVKVFKDGKFQTAMDILDLSEQEGYMPYGIKAGKPIMVEGIRFTPLSEQLQRKTVATSFLRETDRGWTTAPEFHRGKDIADVIGGIESQMLVYEMTGKRAPADLVSTRDRFGKMIAPGSPLEEMVNSRTMRTVPEEARLRLSTYKTDITPTEYTRLPLTGRYMKTGSMFDGFDFIRTAGGRFDAEAAMLFPPKPRKSAISPREYPSMLWEFEKGYPVFGLDISGYRGFSFASPPAMFGKGGYTGVWQIPTGSRISPNYSGFSQIPTGSRILGNLYPTASQFFGMKYPGGTGSRRVSLDTIPGEYPATPTTPARWDFYPGSQSPRERTGYPAVDIPGYSRTRYPPNHHTPSAGPPKYPSLFPPEKYPPIKPPTKYPPLFPPEKYPPGKYPPEKYPPGKYPPMKPPKYPPTNYPPIKPPAKYPPLYPPEKYPPVKPSIYPPIKPPAEYPPLFPPVEYPPMKPPTKYPPLFPPTEYPPPPRSPPTITPPRVPPPRFPPRLPPITPPFIPIIPGGHRLIPFEEKPPKPPLLRLHFDLLASKWNIKNPVPTIVSVFGSGKPYLPRDDVRIFNKQITKDTYRKTLHPYSGVYEELKVKRSGKPKFTFARGAEWTIRDGDSPRPKGKQAWKRFI